MDTEKLATSAIEDSISLTDVLSPFINDGDKEPSWDGNIYIYEDKKKSKKGIKKVPVQVKGEKRKRVPPKKKPKYSVRLIDLDNWLNDGGIMLFVVLIDESGLNKVIYYSALVPVLIRHLKKFAKGKKSISVPLKEFPTDNNKKVSILLDFYNHMQKQTSFANAPLYTLDELEKEGVLENVSFTFTTYGRATDDIDVENILLHNDVYMYAKVKGSSVLQPLPDVPKDIHIAKNVRGEIKVKECMFYNSYRVIRYVEGFDIHIGKSINVTYNPGEKKGAINYKVRGTLSDYIRDTECIIAVIENREITINGATIHFDHFKNAEANKYRQKLLYYKDVKKMLDMLGVKKELVCENLSDEDETNIRNFTNALVLGGNIGFPGSKDDMIYGRFQLANLTILIWADRIEKKGEWFRLQSYFSNHKIALFDSADKKREKPYPITHYALLRKKDFLDAVNIDYEKIVEDLPQNHTSSIVTEKLILFMLEMLKAYDEQKTKDEALLTTAEAYCDWLNENADNSADIMALNRLQIIRRKRDFDDMEISQLKDLRKNSDNLSVKCGANILLGRMESAQDCFDEMEEKERMRFIEYPICHFGKLKYDITEDNKWIR